MIYLQLFLSFFEIGLFTFGGGYAMISFIREKALAYGWMDEAELLNAIAISESTPGPIAVNMATLVGSETGGFLGALVATLGVVLPSFFVILLVSSLLRGVLRYRGVKAFLGGVRPCVVALILSTALTLSLGTLLNFTGIGNGVSPDLRALLIFAILLAVALLWQRLKGKKPSPILMLLLSAGLGMIFYAL